MPDDAQVKRVLFVSVLEDTWRVVPDPLMNEAMRKLVARLAQHINLS